MGYGQEPPSPVIHNSSSETCRHDGRLHGKAQRKTRGLRKTRRLGMLIPL